MAMLKFVVGVEQRSPVEASSVASLSMTALYGAGAEGWVSGTSLVSSSAGGDSDHAHYLKPWTVDLTLIPVFICQGSVATTAAS